MGRLAHCGSTRSARFLHLSKDQAFGKVLIEGSRYLLGLRESLKLECELWKPGPFVAPKQNRWIYKNVDYVSRKTQGSDHFLGIGRELIWPAGIDAT